MTTGRSMTGRAALTRAVACCAVGSAVSIFAVTRTWAVQVQTRPAPLSPLHVSRSGTYFVPLLSALALVGLAGTGALLATRGRWRRVVGVVIAIAGLGVLAAAVDGLVTVDGVRVLWPLLCVPAGLLLVAGGGWAAAQGAQWPAMGARYERGPAARRAATVPDHDHGHRHEHEAHACAAGHEDAHGDDFDDDYDGDIEEQTPSPVERSGPSPSEIAMWDALDRGEDPSR
jgi:Tryptophan-associated transmembrane protein (Trp_oprn_chp)